MTKRNLTLHDVHEGHYLLTIGPRGHRLWAVQPNGQVYTDAPEVPSAAEILAMFLALNAEVDAQKRAADPDAS